MLGAHIDETTFALNAHLRRGCLVLAILRALDVAARVAILGRERTRGADGTRPRTVGSELEEVQVLHVA